jgi:hypothetical protein
MKKCLLIAGLSILVTLVAVACGGDNKQPQVITQSDLRDMVTLDSEGLPWQISLRQEGVVSNDDAADQTFDPEQWRKDYTTWGRITGHNADYDAEDGRIAVVVEVELYKSDSGAAEAWAAAREYLLSQVVNESPEETGADGIGDQSSVFHFEFDSPQTDSYVFFFRRGSVLAQAGIGGLKGEISQEDAIAVARLLDERIKSALDQ